MARRGQLGRSFMEYLDAMDSFAYGESASGARPGDAVVNSCISFDITHMQAGA